MSIRRHLSLILLFVLGITLASCSSSGPQESTNDSPTGPPFEVLIQDDAGLSIYAGPTLKTTNLVAGVTKIQSTTPAHHGRMVAVAVETADSTKLVVVEMPGARLHALHAVAGKSIYTVAWSPDGEQLAWGHYRERRDGDNILMGTGDILMGPYDGSSSRRVGCSGSKAVIQWRVAGRLVVRANDNIYEVEARNCRTTATIDARKIKSYDFSGSGQQLAYVERELAYNRTSRKYEPSFSLVLAGGNGQSPNRIAGDKYDAQNPVWSPDGKNLAFDIQSQQNAEARHMALYTVETGETTSLVKAEDLGNLPTDTNPQWSYDGQNLAFQRNHDAVKVLVVRDSDAGGITEVGPYAGGDWAWVTDKYIAQFMDGAVWLSPAQGGGHLNVNVPGKSIWVVPTN